MSELDAFDKANASEAADRAQNREVLARMEMAVSDALELDGLNALVALDAILERRTQGAWRVSRVPAGELSPEAEAAGRNAGVIAAAITAVTPSTGDIIADLVTILGEDPYEDGPFAINRQPSPDPDR